MVCAGMLKHHIFDCSLGIWLSVPLLFGNWGMLTETGWDPLNLPGGSVCLRFEDKFEVRGVFISLYP